MKQFAINAAIVLTMGFFVWFLCVTVPAKTPSQSQKMTATWLVQTKSGAMYESEVIATPEGYIIKGAVKDIFIPKSNMLSMKRVDIDASKNSSATGRNILRDTGR